MSKQSIIERDINFYKGEVERLSKTYASDYPRDESITHIRLQSALRVQLALEQYKRALEINLRVGDRVRYKADLPASVAPRDLTEIGRVSLIEWNEYGTDFLVQVEGDRLAGSHWARYLETV